MICSKKIIWIKTVTFRVTTTESNRWWCQSNLPHYGHRVVSNIKEDSVFFIFWRERLRLWPSKVNSAVLEGDFSLIIPYLNSSIMRFLRCMIKRINYVVSASELSELSTLHSLQAQWCFYPPTKMIHIRYLFDIDLKRFKSSSYAARILDSWKCIYFMIKLIKVELWFCFPFSL